MFSENGFEPLISKKKKKRKKKEQMQNSQVRFFPLYKLKTIKFEKSSFSFWELIKNAYFEL